MQHKLTRGFTRLRDFLCVKFYHVVQGDGNPMRKFEMHRRVLIIVKNAIFLVEENLRLRNYLLLE